MQCRRKLLKQTKKFQRLNEKRVIFAKETATHNFNDEKTSSTDSIFISTLSYPSSSSNKSVVEKQTNETFEFDFNFPKSDFFLYTIHEHQMLTKKKFSYKKRLYNTLSSNLSKSDSNIAKSCDNKSFI